MFGGVPVDVVAPVVFAQEDAQAEFAAVVEEARGLFVVQGLQGGLEFGAHALGVHAEGAEGLGHVGGVGFDGTSFQVGDALNAPFEVGEVPDEGLLGGSFGFVLFQEAG